MFVLNFAKGGGNSSKEEVFPTDALLLGQGFVEDWVVGVVVGPSVFVPGFQLLLDKVGNGGFSVH